MLCAWLALALPPARQNGTLASLGELLLHRLPAGLLVPGWTGYYGWNYESAVALEALRNPPWHAAPAVENLLRSQAPAPWQPGWWLALHFPATFLWTAGDRIGLFGSLFRDVQGAHDVYCSALHGVRRWPRHANWTALLTRNFGFGHGRGCRRWLWLDDVYMAGAPLLADYPDEVWAMLGQARQAFLDPADQLWWHGRCDPSGATNGVKWGRAHAWALLALARYVVRTNDSRASEWLHQDLLTLSRYQRPPGAFGNIVNDPHSPSEASLTSAYVYAVAVLARARGNQSQELRGRALAALGWLDTRRTRGLRLSDSCPATGLLTSPARYNRQVSATTLVAGPAVALAAWARVGGALLHNASATHYVPASWAQAAADPCGRQQRLSPAFYALVVLGATALATGGGCCCSLLCWYKLRRTRR